MRYYEYNSPPPPLPVPHPKKLTSGPSRRRNASDRGWSLAVPFLFAKGRRTTNSRPRSIHLRTQSNKLRCELEQGDTQTNKKTKKHASSKTRMFLLVLLLSFGRVGGGHQHPRSTPGTCETKNNTTKTYGCDKYAFCLLQTT